MRSHFVRRTGLGLALTIFLAGAPAWAGGTLFDAIRRDDVAAVKAMTAAGADVNAADETGATPLMYAAIYASPECMQALIDKGAAVNARNRFGATPLMWAASRAPQVKMLLSRGADVNARASDGTNALVVATRFNNADAMQALIAAGADPHAAADRAALLSAAYANYDPAARNLLTSLRVERPWRGEFILPVLGRHLTNAADEGIVARLLNDGAADPFETLPLITFSLPTFFVAARSGNLPAMAAFVAQGFDPKEIGPHGWTTLMMAAGSDTPSKKAMQFLLDAGVNVNAVDEDGRTALDWALTRGENDTTAFLRHAGAVSKAAAFVAPKPVAAPRSAREAVERALAQIQPVGPKFSDRTKCNSCHNQNIPAIAVAHAKSRGLSLNESLVGHSMKVTNVGWSNRRDPVLLGDTYGGGFQANISYGLLEMSESHVPATVQSDAMVLGLAARQLPDGSWPEGVDIRPPLTPSAIVSTALAARGIRQLAPAGRRDEMEARVARAKEYLRSAVPQDPIDAMFRMVGLVWTGASDAEINQARHAVIGLQRPDGGWAQLTSLDSDAYATGLALYALHSAGMKSDAAPYQKGADFLLRTQLEDGTWFVKTRAFGFQPYFETGFPHGRSQFISTVATSWAATALSFTLDK
jgi:ankyrin repeat protein